MKLRSHVLPLVGVLVLPAVAVAADPTPSALGIPGTDFAQAQPAATAPRPATAPAAAPSQQQMAKFMVFFDWDKAVLTNEAKRIVAASVEEFKRTGQTRVTVIGHTDTSGSAEYNQRLSERRAAAVKAEMTRLGVPANVITTIGRGQNDLLVPTKDNVREAQNRRAVIEFPAAPPPPRPVAQAPAPAPAPKKPVWGPQAGDIEASIGPSVGIYSSPNGVGDTLGKRSVGGTGQIGYYATDNIEVGVRHSILAQRFYQSTRAFGEYNFRVSDEFLPYIGVIAGGVYGSAIENGYGVGPSLGFKYYPWAKTFVDVGADGLFVVNRMGSVWRHFNIIPRVALGFNF